MCAQTQEFTSRTFWRFVIHLGCLHWDINCIKRRRYSKAEERDLAACVYDPHVGVPLDGDVPHRAVAERGGERLPHDVFDVAERGEDHRRQAGLSAGV